MTNSGIEWTTHTFNPWRGCTKVSDGCKNCYADTLSKRNPKSLGIWGPRGTRVIASEAYWREPLKWNAAAKAAGARHRVFCASLADVGEGEDTMPAGAWIDVQMARIRLSHLIMDCDHLDFLLLTKRPENMPRLFDRVILERAWVGTSVENQQAADERIPHLLKCPAAVRFLSCEPLLGPIDFMNADGDRFRGGMTGAIHWVIIGGESGPGARPCNVDWIRSIVSQCKAAGVACFVKQLGAWPFDPSWHGDGTPAGSRMTPNDKKGGDITEFPADLRVREFPRQEAPTR